MNTIEILHGELIDAFHRFRKAKTSNPAINLVCNGKDFNSIVVDAKKAYHEKHGKNVFSWIDCKENQPNEAGRYLVCRKDGKIHFENWNGTGWAYNHASIEFWTKIVEPTTLSKKNSKKN